MPCKPLMGVRFGPKSRAAIVEIRTKQLLSRTLQVLVPVGTVATIFLGSSALEASFNVYSTDFEMMARAVNAVPAIERAVVLRVARFAAFDTVGVESLFWRQFVQAVNEGCVVVAD